MTRDGEWPTGHSPCHSENERKWGTRSGAVPQHESLREISGECHFAAFPISCRKHRNMGNAPCSIPHQLPKTLECGERASASFPIRSRKRRNVGNALRRRSPTEGAKIQMRGIASGRFPIFFTKAREERKAQGGHSPGRGENDKGWGTPLGGVPQPSLKTPECEECHLAPENFPTCSVRKVEKNLIFEYICNICVCFLL